MARYEVVARAKPDRRLSNAAYIDLALNSWSLDKGLRFQRIEDLPDGTVAIVDVREASEWEQGHLPGARNLDLGRLFAGPGRPESAGRIQALVGLPEGSEVVAYCHSGSRSALATLALRFAGYDARNYAGSWHEWSRHPELPLER